MCVEDNVVIFPKLHSLERELKALGDIEDKIRKELDRQLFSPRPKAVASELLVTDQTRLLESFFSAKKGGLRAFSRPNSELFLDQARLLKRSWLLSSSQLSHPGSDFQHHGHE